MDSSRRRFICTTGTVLTAGVAGCAGGAGPTAADVDGDVAVGAGSSGFDFDPAELTVAVGDTVVWEWTGAGGAHNVVHDAENPAFESELVTEAGHIFEHTFDEAGTYEYVCEPHITQGMVGTIIVE